MNPAPIAGNYWVIHNRVMDISIEAGGYAQLTGRWNYGAWSDQLGINLIKNPGLAATPDIAAQVIIGGMDRGSFRSRRPE
jgi:hypothetical protein